MAKDNATTIRVSKKTREFIARVSGLEGKTADAYVAGLLLRYANDLTDAYAVKILKEVKAEYQL